MAIQFKCRSCSEEGTAYLPERGEHYCEKHAPLDERQVPACSGFEPVSLVAAAVREIKRLQSGETQ